MAVQIALRNGEKVKVNGKIQLPPPTHFGSAQNQLPQTTFIVLRRGLFEMARLIPWLGSWSFYPQKALQRAKVKERKFIPGSDSLGTIVQATLAIVQSPIRASS